MAQNKDPQIRFRVTALQKAKLDQVRGRKTMQQFMEHTVEQITKEVK